MTIKQLKKELQENQIALPTKNMKKADWVALYQREIAWNQFYIFITKSLLLFVVVLFKNLKLEICMHWLGGLGIKGDSTNLIRPSYKIEIQEMIVVSIRGDFYDNFLKK